MNIGGRTRIFTRSSVCIPEQRACRAGPQKNNFRRGNEKKFLFASHQEKPECVYACIKRKILVKEAFHGDCKQAYR